MVSWHDTYSTGKVSMQSHLNMERFPNLHPKIPVASGQQSYVSVALVFSLLNELSGGF